MMLTWIRMVMVRKKKVDGFRIYLGGDDNSSWGLRKKEEQSWLPGLWVGGADPLLIERTLEDKLS